jgi:hypothetical protein
VTRPTTPHRGVVSESVTVEIPLTFKKRCGRKQVIMPDGNCLPVRISSDRTSRTGADATLVKALARAHRWKQIFEDGSYSSITELACAEGVNRSYLCRMLRLTLLGPDITTEMLNGGSRDITLKRLLQPFSIGWHEQRISGLS